MSSPIFVCGATGTQGGAVARHLRKADIPVHALVRDPTAPKAKKLQDLGVTLFPGSFEDDACLRAAVKGTRAAFLNFTRSASDPKIELKHARAVLAAARDAGATHIVYTSSFGLEDNAALQEERDPEGYITQIYRAKREVVNEVAAAGFESYAILCPGKFMSDLFGPNAAWFGGLTVNGVYETALREGEAAPWVDPDDIGAFGAAALLDPKKYNGKRVNVFTEFLAIEDVVSVAAQATGKDLSVRFLTEEEVEEKIKGGDMFIRSQVGMRGMGRGESMESVRSWGVPLSSYRSFLDREKTRLWETYSHLPDLK